MTPRFRRKPAHPPRGYRLRHGIFFALSGTVILAVLIAAVVVHRVSGSAGERPAFEAFTSDRFRVVWEDSPRRDDLARSVERHFKLRVTLRDASGRIVYGDQQTCPHGAQLVTVLDGTRVLGQVEACVQTSRWSRGLVLGLGSLVLALWAMSGLIARALMRPLETLVEVVQRIGEGHLDARVQLCKHHREGELGAVAEAVNLMAERIERQMAGQRELLAAVSHEIRSPLARLRMLVELQRESEGSTTRLDSMDVELEEMDSLVGQLLSQSRLEFQALDRRSLLAIEVARTALERASLPPSMLVDESQGAKVKVDVGLFGRALQNLLGNARSHGRGPTGFTVRLKDGRVIFEIRDQGPGFDAAVLSHSFEPFVASAKEGGLGLGLSLVSRIARVHEGRVRLANGDAGGAVVTLEVPLDVERVESLPRG